MQLSAHFNPLPPKWLDSERALAYTLPHKVGDHGDLGMTRMHSLTDFLFPAPARRSTTGIVRWWEARRLHYNLIVGVAGVMSLAAMRIITWLPPNSHDDFVPPVVIIVFGVMANVCYLLGPAVEIGLEKLWGRKTLPAGPTLFRMGLTFSVGLALLPTLIAGFDWGFRILRTLF